MLTALLVALAVLLVVAVWLADGRSPRQMYRDRRRRRGHGGDIDITGVRPR